MTVLWGGRVVTLPASSRTPGSLLRAAGSPAPAAVPPRRHIGGGRPGRAVALARLHRRARARRGRPRRDGVARGHGRGRRLPPRAWHHAHARLAGHGAPDAVVEQLGWVADAVAAGPRPSGHVVGAHLEGPFLAPSRRGAQNPDHVLVPDHATFARFVEAGRGTVRSMTIAPNCPVPWRSSPTSWTRAPWPPSGTPMPPTPKHGPVSTPERRRPPTCSTACGP